MAPTETDSEHWTNKRVWTTLAFVIGLLPFGLLLNLTDSFYLDWKNHLWMISYAGEYFRQHWTFPVTLNTQQLVGMPYPVFYGFLFFPAAGLISSFAGGNVAMRAVCLGVAILQVAQVRKTAAAYTGNRFFAFAVAVICSFATYPLTNLYNRAAVPEFVATSLIVSVCMMGMRLHLVEPKARALLILRGGLLLALAIGTHPITAVLGSVVVLALIVLLSRRIKDHADLWKPLAAAGALIVLVALPWAWALSHFAGDLNINETTGFVNVMPLIDRAATRFSLLPRDPRMGTSELVKLGTPNLDTQVSVPLIALALILLVIAIRRRNGWAFELRAGAVAVASCAFLSFASISAGIWKLLPRSLHFIQFTYRLVTYIDLAALLAVVFLGAIVLKYRRTRLLTICISAAVAMAFVSMVVKQSHAVAGNDSAVLPGSEISSAQRDELQNLPATFYGKPAYASRAGTAGKMEASLMISLPVGTGPTFGEVQPAQRFQGTGGVVDTNVQIFPWNHIAVNGSEIPFSRLGTDEDLHAVVPVPAELVTLTYALRPDPIWEILRGVSLWATALWALAVIRVRKKVRPEPVPETGGRAGRKSAPASPPPRLAAKHKRAR